MENLRNSPSSNMGKIVACNLIMKSLLIKNVWECLGEKEKNNLSADRSSDSNHQKTCVRKMNHANLSLCMKLQT